MSENNQHNIQQLKELLRRYYMGETTIEEEKQLRNLASTMQEKDVPEELRIDLRMLRGLEEAASDKMDVELTPEMECRFNSLIDRLGSEEGTTPTRKNTKQKVGRVIRWMSYAGVACAAAVVMAIGIWVQRERWEYPNGESAPTYANVAKDSTFKKLPEAVYVAQDTHESTPAVKEAPRATAPKEIVMASSKAAPTAKNTSTSRIAKKTSTTEEPKPTEGDEEQLMRAISLLEKAVTVDHKPLRKMGNDVAVNYKKVESVVTNSFEILN